jgi:hypothetical protein
VEILPVLLQKAPPDDPICLFRFALGSEVAGASSLDYYYFCQHGFHPGLLYGVSANFFFFFFFRSFCCATLPLMFGSTSPFIDVQLLPAVQLGPTGTRNFKARSLAAIHVISEFRGFL